MRTPSCRQSIGTWPIANLPRLYTPCTITARLVKQASMHTSRLFIMPLTMFCKISSSRFVLETHASSNYHVPLACFAGIPMICFRSSVKTTPPTFSFTPIYLRCTLFARRHCLTSCLMVMLGAFRQIEPPRLLKKVDLGDLPDGASPSPLGTGYYCNP